MEILGIAGQLRESVVRSELERDAVLLGLKSGVTIETESVLIAAGRLGNTRGLGLDCIGLEVGERGHLTVNDAPISPLSIYTIPEQALQQRSRA